MTPLATIKEPGQDGRTALYWREGSIWSREPAGGTEWSNSVAPCCLRDAIKVIRAVWGQGYDLLFRDIMWIEMISAIIQGYDLEADPMAVRAEMEKYHELDELLCADFIDAVRQAAGDAPIGYSVKEIPE